MVPTVTFSPDETFNPRVFILLRQPASPIFVSFQHCSLLHTLHNLTFLGVSNAYVPFHMLWYHPLSTALFQITHTNHKVA